MNIIFNKLLSEASFTNDILVNGIEQLGNVNFSRKGLYFSAFTSISTGIERIGKLCLIIDYYIQNNGSFPNVDFLKNEIGHDIQKLYKKSQLILEARHLSLNNMNELTDPVHQDILKILCSFAKGERYSNINFLLNNKVGNDPIVDWYDKIETAIFNNYTTPAQKEQMRMAAIEGAKIFKEAVSVRFLSEIGTEINSLEKSNFLLSVSECNKKQRQLHVLQIARYFIEILCELEYSARNIKNEIPFFKEVFMELRNSDKDYLKNKRFFDVL